MVAKVQRYIRRGVCVGLIHSPTPPIQYSPQRGRHNRAQGKFRAAKRGPGFGPPNAHRALNGRNIFRTVSRPESVPPIQGGEFAGGPGTQGGGRGAPLPWAGLGDPVGASLGEFAPLGSAISNSPQRGRHNKAQGKARAAGCGPGFRYPKRPSRPEWAQHIPHRLAPRICAAHSGRGIRGGAGYPGRRARGALALGFVG